MKEKEKNGERRRMSPPKIYSRSATAYTSLISKQTNKSFLNNPFLYHVYYQTKGTPIPFSTSFKHKNVA